MQTTTQQHPILESYKGNTIRKDGEKVRIYWGDGSPVITCDSLHAAHLVIDKLDSISVKPCSTEHVKKFAQNHLNNTLTDCKSVRVHCVSVYQHVPIHMWHIWYKYIYSGRVFDGTLEIWQHGKELEICQYTEVWS